MLRNASFRILQSHQITSCGSHRPPAARLPHPFTTSLPSQTSIPVAGPTVCASLSSPWTFLKCSASPTG
ncbi:hypothetical protein FRX31_018127 [Thalictrum thalictroides]|uniref:Uncharacterized protein n=1 Tax=Thalictrum thalictroides TaxID=46969 RepID=A0A7J6W4I0_THATH|nr:hypothetical protein FRX31_018127 [Thalictrum thalictroides]